MYILSRNKDRNERTKYLGSHVQIATSWDTTLLHCNPRHLLLGSLVEGGTAQVQFVDVGLDNLGHDEGGLLDSLPLASDGDDDIPRASFALLDTKSGPRVVGYRLYHLKS